MKHSFKSKLLSLHIKQLTLLEKGRYFYACFVWSSMEHMALKDGLTAHTSTCFYKEINVHFKEFMFRQTDVGILS